MSLVEHDDSIGHDRPPVKPQTCPWLLISHGNQFQKHNLYSVTENQCYERDMPWLRNKIVLYNRYGWIACQDNDTHVCYLFNPISFENIELPPPPKSMDVGRIWLSKRPGHPECSIFIIGKKGGRIGVCKFGGKKFVESNVRLGTSHLMQLIAFEGKIYGLMMPCYSLVTVNVVRSAVKIKRLLKDGLPFQISNPLPRENFAFNYYLIDSCDTEEVFFVFKIYSASFSRQVSRFKVFRLNFIDRTCEQLQSIGKRVMFLSGSHGMSFSITRPEIRVNSIYYVESGDNRLYAHNLEDQSRLLKLPSPDTRHDALLSWVTM